MKTENINAAVFVLGGSIKLNRRLTKRSDGTSEYYNTIYTLARNPSISRVTILSRSNWKNLSEQEKFDIDPRGILFDAFTELKVPLSSVEEVADLDQYSLPKWRMLEEKMRELGPDATPDFGVGFVGPGYFTNNAIPQFLSGKRDPTKKVRVLLMTMNYSSYIVHYLNKNLDIPWFMIITDPRYIYTHRPNRFRDTVNRPLEGISQFSQELEWESIDTYDADAPETIKKFPIHYSGIEKMNTIGQTPISPDNERAQKFSIVAMQSSYGKNAKGDYRFKELKKWVLEKDKNQELSIYGKWADEITAGYSQFKGYIDPGDIDEIFRNTRYTLVIPISPKWVTSKYAEMLMTGVLPFFHPDYDQQNHLIKHDHFLRVKDADDLQAKMEFMDKNPDKRIKLIKALQDRFLSNTKDGIFLYEILNKSFDRNNLDMRLDLEVSNETNRTYTKAKSLF